MREFVLFPFSLLPMFLWQKFEFHYTSIRVLARQQVLRQIEATEVWLNYNKTVNP